MRTIDGDALKAVFEEKSSEAVCGVELCKAIQMTGWRSNGLGLVR